MESKISTNQINPVDFFNMNYVDWMFNTMTSLKNVEKTSIDSLTYITNRSDATKRMIVIENDHFIAKEKNGLNMEVDKKYTPFMMLQKFSFKDKFSLALSFVVYDLMKNDVPYIRIGTKYFKKTVKRDRNGIKRNELKVWDKQTLVDDYGKQMIDDTPKFDDFTMEPDNKNHTEIIGNNYNLYAPFEHKPCKESEYQNPLQFHWTNTLIEHIFGEQYAIGLKYIKVLYDMPKQKLPILVLISEERSTGKTTFVDWLEILFGANSVIINPENISAQFNGAYADKNIIMIEESRFESTQATEKLKNLSTQKKILVNTKFIQHYSIPFHGKIIITSNDENKFSKVDDPEIRYWVRKIPTLRGKANHNILEDMTKEIPYFLHYLSTLEDIDTTKSRMVFESDELLTDALTKVKSESKSSLHKEIEIMMDDHCANNVDYPEFEFISKDMKEMFFRSNNQIDVNYINRILRDSFKLKKSKMKRYIPFNGTENHFAKKVSGRPYVYSNPYYSNDKENEI